MWTSAFLANTRSALFKLVRYNRGQKIQFLLLFMTTFCVFKRLTNGQKFYLLSFDYPIENLSEVVMEVETRGVTKIQELNNITKLYSYIIDPMKTENSKNEFKNLEMIFVVKSFVGNVGQRAAIRNTWGKSDNFRMKTIFVLGYLEPMQTLIEEENKLYKDILQLNMEDQYDNLVYKTIYSILWLTNHQIDTKYVHLLDDDRLVNTESLYKFSLNNLSQQEVKMIGYQVSWGMPYRDTDSKWFTSLSDYPYDFWPPYLIGGTILTNMVVIKTIAKAFPFTRIIRMEDAFIGILSKLLHIKLEHNNGFLPYFISGTQLKTELSSPDYKKFHLVINGWKMLNS